MYPILILVEAAFRRRGGTGGCGSLGCFSILLICGIILYFVFRGRGDKPEQLGAAKRAMGSGPIADHTFACPYAKCPTCAASGDKMKQQWDGLRKVTWTCGYCGNVAGIQELKDDELPPSARQQLGLDPPPVNVQSGFPAQGGSSVDGLLTGMMIGSMMNAGEHHHHQNDDWGNGDGQGTGGSDWSDSGGGDSGSDWNDSGSNDSNGNDS